MKVYKAIGGIGCSLLRLFQEKESIENRQCYYIDTDCAGLSHNATDGLNSFLIGSVSDCVSEGSGGFRNIGKSVTRFSILSNRMNDLFEALKELSDVELVFVTTSFGGTGSGAVFEIAEYVQALLWQPHNNRCIDCSILALNYNCFSYMESFPKKIKEIFDINTIQMVMEASTKTNIYADEKTIEKINASIFNPFYNLFLIDEPIYEFDELYKVLSFDKPKLVLLDKKGKYIIKQKSVAPEVFISYSSKDQDIADSIADALKENGINSWIASRSIVEGPYAKQIMQGINGAKIFMVLLSRHSIYSQHVKNEIDRAFARLDDGLLIVPFIIEQCELDDECQYYLCRQEMFDGSQPPINQRINDVVNRIKTLLD